MSDTSKPTISVLSAPPGWPLFDQDPLALGVCSQQSCGGCEKLLALCVQQADGTFASHYANAEADVLCLTGEGIDPTWYAHHAQSAEKPQLLIALGDCTLGKYPRSLQTEKDLIGQIPPAHQPHLLIHGCPPSQQTISEALQLATTLAQPDNNTPRTHTEHDIPQQPASLFKRLIHRATQHNTPKPSDDDHADSTPTPDGVVARKRKQITARRIKIHGKVHRVGFRDFLQKIARTVDVHGWVCNCFDHTVLAEIAGNDEAIAKFLAYCHQGPPHAEVEFVEVCYWPGTVEPKNGLVISADRPGSAWNQEANTF